MMFRRFGRLLLLFPLLSLLAITPPLRAADLVEITEFMASNTHTLADEDGVFPDWIELRNAGTTPVNLLGWSLTDDPANLTKWRFPATNLAIGAYVVVFASGKNRTVPGAPLHTSFSLSASGEYLALVQSNGLTIATVFAPVFPEQFSDISYGIGQNILITTLISNTSPVRVFVPTNGSLGATWTAVNFDDAAWTSGTNGVGYETYVPGFAVRNIRANIGVCDLGTADGVLANPAQQAGVFTETRGVVNYVNTGGGANFGGDATFPGFTINVDADNFVTEATGLITIPATGAYTFGVNSDDGFRCVIGANTVSYPSPRGPGDTFATFTLAAGEYPVRLVFYECGGGAELEFFAAPGAFAGFNASFRLVGDTANGGLAVKSLPIANVSGSFRGVIRTDVQAPMFGRNPSAYLRLPFTLPNGFSFSTLTLPMKYDDGFVAYLNGTEVARRNAPASVQWNSAATATRPNALALVSENIDLTPSLGLLQAGANVLAVQGCNDAANSTDFLIVAELSEFKVLSLTNHYFSTPSPGGPNTAGFFAFVDNLNFTPGRGWFGDTNLSVQISTATPGALIRYTTNGSVPNLTNSFVYTGPIPITNTTTLRAVGFRDGFEPTVVETHSYIFLSQVQRQSTNGNWVGGSSGNYTLDTNITLNSSYAGTFPIDLTNIPTLSLTLSWEDLFGPGGVMTDPNASGPAAEHPCSVEYMRPDGQQGFHVNCGVRVQGGVSRSAIPKHGLRLLFKDSYGPSKLSYNLYPDSPVKDFDTLTLHGAFNDHWLWVGSAATLHRDQWCRDTQNAMGGYGPHGTYAHLYLNGIYWGLYNIGEKGDASFAAHFLGGDKTEYDAFNSDKLIDGDANAWNTMFALAGPGITTDAAYTNLSQYLDIPNFIDYLLMNFYAANTDWPGHNWNAARRRAPGAGFHFFSWDAEWTLGIGNDVNTDRTPLSDGSPGRLYAALRQHPEFRMQFADHAQKHLFNGGALTPAATEARWLRRSKEIDRAIIGETSRWGNGNTRQTWLNAEAAVRSWFPQRSDILVSQLRNAGLYPQLNAPRFTPFGGLVPPDYSLALTNPNPTGTMYFTFDGSDPRLWGGGLSGAALLYPGPITLSNAVTLRARVKEGTNWSALVGATFYVVQDFRALAVTEIMYHPPSFGLTNGDEVEFLELKNTGTNALDLSGLQFTDGLAFAFTNGTRLAPGGFFVLARNPAVFAAKYPGVTVHGIYASKLNNNGERLTLAHPLGTNVFSFRFDTRPPWPITPDGYGFSLVRANVAGDPGAPSSWRPSAALGGSPGADDPAASIPPVVINEILTHSDPPQLDSIELFNPTTDTVDLSGWFLSDDAAAPKKFRVPTNTVLAPGGFVVFAETSFNPLPGVPPSFALSSTGESLYLFSGDAATNLTGYSHSFDYGAAAPGVPFGRYILSTGEEQWPALDALTPGAMNAAPRIGPVVINEILYHPETGYDEFVELKNITGTNVALFDPGFPTSAWRLSGLNFTFPSNTTLAGNAFLLLSSIDPVLFRAKYSVPAGVEILGPFAGALQDSGERLSLERPGAPNPGTNSGFAIPYIVVDEVRYNDKLPWPVGADGDGPSIQRQAPDAYGNEPTNWFASGLTPGVENVFNAAPTVTILSPTNGTVFDAPASFILSAQASDPDGVVSRVEFFRDGLKLGESSASPFNFTVGNLGAGAYTFTAKARDSGLATASSSVTVLVNPPPVGTGTGLFGEYYDALGFTGPRLTRLDPTVDFHWGGGAPDPSMGSDQFTVRWTGQVQPRLSATYTFYTVSDDGVRLWVNNLLLIDNWTDHGDTENSGSVSLVAGSRYDIRMEMYENGGGATATLAWSTPDLTKEIIPSTQLYSMRRPTLLAQPQNLYARLGSNVSFNVTADGTPPLRYQWFFNGVAIPGATATNLPLANVRTTNIGSYFVVITNSEGSATSVLASLVLVEPALFAQQPQSRTVLVGDTVAFNMAASGTSPIAYRWRKNGQTYVPFGVATATLTMTNVQLTNAGSYTVVITNIAQPGVLSATAVLTVLVDTDGDRLPDVWEIANGFDTNSVADANIDTDGDGMTNLQEYIAGTNPRDPMSYLKVDQISMTGSATLLFAGVSNKTYTVQFRDSASSGAWMKLTNVVSAPTNRTLRVIDPAGGTTPVRYYRLATPALP